MSNVDQTRRITQAEADYIRAMLDGTDEGEQAECLHLVKCFEPEIYGSGVFDLAELKLKTDCLEKAAALLENYRQNEAAGVEGFGEPKEGRLRLALDVARRLIAQSEEAAAADAGFDAGEFSGPAHDSMLDDALTECAASFGLTRDELRDGLVEPEDGERDPRAVPERKTTYRRISTAAAISHIIPMGFKAFHFEGNTDVVMVSAEEGDDAADYYGEGKLLLQQELGRPVEGAGLPYINPKLVEWAEKYGLDWEWVNPGCIAAYRQ